MRWLMRIIWKRFGTFQNAIKIDPSFFDAYFKLGMAAISAKDFSQAANAFNRALMLRPDSADARYSFAWHCRK